MMNMKLLEVVTLHLFITMLVSEKLMVDFQEMHFYTKKDLYINFQKHASFFRKAMPIKINGGGNSQFYGPPKRVCATKNNDFPMEYI